MDFSRRKSCAQCRLAKTRCNLDSPTCSRCRKKRLHCNYEHRTQSSTSPLAQNNIFHSWLASTNAEGGSVPVDINQNEASCEFRDSEYLEFPVLFDAAFDDLSAPLPMELSTTQVISEAGLTNATEAPTRSPPGHSMDGESIFWIDYQLSSSANDSVSAPPQHNSVLAKQGDVSSVSSVMKNASKLLLENWQALREMTGDLPTLLHRTKPTTMLSLTIGNFIWATIESYAIQLRRRSLPPFIHRSSCAKEIEDRCLDFDKLPEPLANCYNIIPLYVQKTPTTQPLAFKTLILEVQRLYDEFQTYNEQTLLSTLQALTIYVIIIAADPDRCKNISVFVGIAVQEICIKVNENSQRCACPVFPSWEDWIQIESRTRTMILLHLMNLILDMNMGIFKCPSCSQFDKLPLPCSKAMWEAESKSEWEDQYKTYLSNMKGGRTLQFGDLRHLNKVEVSSLGVDRVDGLSAWSKGVDNFGAMLLLVVQQNSN